MQRIFFSLVLLVFLIMPAHLVFARGNAPVDSPPVGIMPTTATLSEVLKAHDVAAGRLTKSGSVRTEAWRFNKAGETGNELMVRHGSDYHSIIQTGPFNEEYGQSGDSRWYKNENGVVTDTTHEESRSFEMFRVLEDASDPKNDVKLLGETNIPQPSYVVEVTNPQNKHPEWIFFDKKTALVVRVETVFEHHRVVSSYDDYQTVQGLTEPSHVHDSIGTTSLDADYHRQSVAFSNEVDTNQFAKLGSANFLGIDRPVNLRARIIRGTVVIRLNVNNRGLDFELSSGDSHSYIDCDVAREMQLPNFGHVTQAERDCVPYETEIKDVTAGELHIRRLALEVLPFTYHADADTKVVGTLGYDFLSQGLFTVDYVNQKVTASPITDAPIDTADMDVIPIWFDAGRPFFTTTIGSHETKNVLLDSSFDLSFVFGSFTQEHPEAVVDAVGGRKHVHTVIPFADSGSYGRDIDVWIANLPVLQVGPMRFTNYRILATDVPMAQGNHPIDAIIGSPFLMYFDVSYDFVHNRVLLKQNRYFKNTFKWNK